MAPDNLPEEEEPQQIMLMRQVVEMAVEQTRLSV